jgi:hypothetical protein
MLKNKTEMLATANCIGIGIGISPSIGISVGISIGILQNFEHFLHSKFTKQGINKIITL